MWRVCTSLSTTKIGKKLWILNEPMLYETPEGMFTVPAGYLTDHASVPRMFTSVVPPVQSCIAESSILHDWFYNTDSEDVPRPFADLCLKELALSLGGSKVVANAAYAAVRMGGGSLYNREPYWNKLKREGYPWVKYATKDILEEMFVGE